MVGEQAWVHSRRLSVDWAQGRISSARAVFADWHASEFRIAPEVIQTVPEPCAIALQGGPGSAAAPS